MNYGEMIRAGLLFIGGYDEMIRVLLCVSAVSCVSRVMRALIKRTLFKGSGIKILFQKILIFMLIGVINLIDVWIFENNGFLRSTVIVYYISIEFKELLDNMVYLEVPVPEKVKKVIEILQ